MLSLHSLEDIFLSHTGEKSLHFIGIKGSGMAALALLLYKRGFAITGSDIADEFYTDNLLHEASISFSVGFNPNNIPRNTDAVFYSAAYSVQNNEELAYAQKYFSCFSYPEALGAFSKSICNTWAVIGTHGKTSTVALVGALLRSQQSLATVLTGARVGDFDNSTFFSDGDEIFIAEVCEYREHFMHFRASGVIFLNAEWDHTDYFKDEESVFKAFAQFIMTLPKGGTVIACISDRGVQLTLQKVLAKRNDMHIIPYKFTLQSPPIDSTVVSSNVPAKNPNNAHCIASPCLYMYGYERTKLQTQTQIVFKERKHRQYAYTDITASELEIAGLTKNKTTEKGQVLSPSQQYSQCPVQSFKLGYSTNVPIVHNHSTKKFRQTGEPNAKNETSTVLDKYTWYMQHPTYPLVGNAMAALLCIEQYVTQLDMNALHNALFHFTSISRRSELLYHSQNIYIVDDYAHHPTSIASTLESLNAHYTPKRCIVDFMSHTYTRTQSLWNEFQTCFTQADILIINDIYSSAREKEEYYANVSTGSMVINGESLASHIGKHQKNVFSIPTFEDSAKYISSIIKEGDLCITMGAGDNFRVAEMLINTLIDKKNANATIG